MAVLKYLDPADGQYKPVSYGGVVPPPVSGVPSGAIMMWMGTAAPPDWQLCDGTLLSRTVHADLFAVIGVTHGIGDGITTFASPNLKGRVPAGSDAGQTEFGTLGQVGGVKKHAHFHVAPTAKQSAGYLQLLDLDAAEMDAYATSSYSFDQVIDVTNVGGLAMPIATSVNRYQVKSTDETGMSPYITVNYIIKL